MGGHLRRDPCVVRFPGNVGDDELDDGAEEACPLLRSQAIGSRPVDEPDRHTISGHDVPRRDVAVAYDAAGAAEFAPLPGKPDRPRVRPERTRCPVQVAEQRSEAGGSFKSPWSGLSELNFNESEHFKPVLIKARADQPPGGPENH